MTTEFEEQDNDDRRQYFRIDMEKEIIGISWINSQNKLVERKIVCEDFSRGGLKLDCDQEIPINTEVTVVFKPKATGSQKLVGKVIRCILSDTGWHHIAVQLN